MGASTCCHYLEGSQELVGKGKLKQTTQGTQTKEEFDESTIQEEPFKNEIQATNDIDLFNENPIVYPAYPTTGSGETKSFKNGEIRTCDFCDFTSEWPIAFAAHVKSHQFCSFCGETFVGQYSKRKLERHVKKFQPFDYKPLN